MTQLDYQVRVSQFSFEKYSDMLRWLDSNVDCYFCEPIWKTSASGVLISTASYFHFKRVEDYCLFVLTWCGAG